MKMTSLLRYFKTKKNFWSQLLYLRKKYKLIKQLEEDGKIETEQMVEPPKIMLKFIQYWV